MEILGEALTNASDNLFFLLADLSKTIIDNVVIHVSIDVSSLSEILLNMESGSMVTAFVATEDF